MTKPNLIALDIGTFDPFLGKTAELERLVGKYVSFDKTEPDQIAARVKKARAEIVVISTSQLTEEVVHTLPGSVKLVCTTSTGIEHIALNAATEQRIMVANAPGFATEAVANTVTLWLLQAARGDTSLPNALVHSGEWELARTVGTRTPGTGLVGKTLGIVGLGNIGQAVAHRAVAFGMKLAVNTPHRKNIPKLEEIEYCDADRIFELSNFLCLTCALTPETTAFVTAARLATMPKGSVVINVSRGPVVVEDALAAALDNGQIARAYTDVLDREKDIAAGRWKSPLMRRDNCIISPHLAWNSIESLNNLRVAVISNVKHYVEHGTPLHPVSSDMPLPTSCTDTPPVIITKPGRRQQSAAIGVQATVAREHPLAAPQ